MSMNLAIVQGCLDGIVGDELVGWFYNPSNTHDGLTVLVDGMPLYGRKTVRCTSQRADLAGVLGESVACGFRFQLSDLPSEVISQISVIDDETGFNFHGESLNYCPVVVDRIPQLRRMFMPEYYRYQYNLEAMSNDEAFSHYVQFGIYAGFNPNPWIDIEYLSKHHSEQLTSNEIPILAYLDVEKDCNVNPSSLFNTEHYATHNPDVDSSMGYLEHYVDIGHLQGRSRISYQLPSSISRELAVLSEFEPDLRFVGNNMNNIVRYPRLEAKTFVPGLVKRRFPKRPKAVICVPFLSHGGADLIATFVLKALEQKFGVDNVLMIVTDKCEHSVSSWTDKSSNILFLDESERVFDLGDRIDLLHAVIGNLAPEMVVNANSHAAWGMYLHYGKQLSTCMELNAYLFCFDYDQGGNPAGYIRDYLPRALPNIDKLFCDNATVIQDISTMFGFSDAQMKKFHTVYVPVPEGVVPSSNENFAMVGKPVLWIGRLARQKRPEILIEIARRMRTQQFVVYGPIGDSAVADQIAGNKIDNIEYRGVYNNFAELDLSEFSFFLNTSAWEGLPTILIQIMASGLPIVSSKVGGIKELVDESTGWLVPNDSDPDSYLSEIRQLYIHRKTALRRSDKGIECVASRHSWGAFFQSLDDAGCFSANGGESSASNVIELSRRAAS